MRTGVLCAAILVYMNVWVDPEKRLQAGYVDPVLVKKPAK